MNESKHTKGPLAVSSSFIIVETETCKVVGNTQPMGVESLDVSYDEAIANAVLFAAAPDLLAACKESLKALQIIYDNTEEEDILARLDCWPLQQLRDAISKAKKGN